MDIAIQIRLNDKLYLKDPESSDLGKRILKHSIILIEKLGFEHFNFKKLATNIKSTEASVYRYFENKHKLLLYLISWYWGWIEYQIAYKTNNINSIEDIFKIMIRVIVESNIEDPNIAHIDESKLHNIVVEESSKAYLTKKVEIENKDGLFSNYKSLINRVADIIYQLNPKYPYPLALASNLIETAHEQIFFAKHLPSITELDYDEKDYSEIEKFLEDIIMGTINRYQ
ncbi:MAG: TetR/AcrR family transcriptional regulator [Cyclobacteriaceae bacterium]|nr:TetR/AcrR family transcriptional regulator [Cyclobacteriaceae bacterium]MCH8515209.1 TetR/AcrR family transcriptional regulator [Cyclobacteriaceae bacterium]